MFQSKSLKEPKESSKLYLWWIDTEISRYYYRLARYLIGNPIYQVKRLVEWYFNVFQFTYDFDGHSLFGIIEYQLKRVYHAIYIEGHADQNPEDVKALKLAIKLAGRLKEDKYEEIGHDRITKKWGESTFTFIPLPNGMSTMNSTRPGTPTKELEELCWKETMEQYRLASIRMKREEKILYAILLKYLRNWWD